MKKLLLASVALLSVYFALAANHRVVSLLNGPSILYVGTGDTAVTFAYTDTYNTNRVFTNYAGVRTTPLSTNTTTGVLAPQFMNTDNAVWANAIGDVGSGTITIAAAADAELTNTAVFTFVRSANGVDYETGQNTFAVTWTPSSTDTVVLTTNVPAAFLTGTKYIRLQKVVTGANPTDDASLTILRLSFNGYAP